MTRIDALQKKYPDIPVEIIVKWDVLGQGVRDTGDIDKVSTWRPAGANYSYQSYDFDLTLKEMVERKPERVKPGYVLRPSHLYMKNGIGASVRIHTKSPYEFREISDGKFALLDGEEKVDVDICFPHPKPRTTPEPVTSKGTPIFSFVSPKRQCFSIMPVRHCEYFARGEQCKFCNLNATQQDSASIGLSRPTTVSIEETVEAYKIFSSEARLVEGRIEMGGFTSREPEARIFTNLVGKIASAATYKPNLLAHAQPQGKKDLQRLKDAGLDCITFQMEVWDPQIFPEVVPGKAKHTPYQEWLEAFLAAVEVFGVGNVGSIFVGGVSLIPARGHKTWQEARDSSIEGNTWMIKNGIVPIFTNLRMPPGSFYWEDESNQKKYPPTEYYLEVGMAHHEAMLEHRLYPKMNKLMHCPLDCLSEIYAGEIGMLALAGDVGNWLADWVAPENNWLTSFVSSVKPSASRAGRTG